MGISKTAGDLVQVAKDEMSTGSRPLKIGMLASLAVGSLLPLIFPGHTAALIVAQLALSAFSFLMVLCITIDH